VAYATAVEEAFIEERGTPFLLTPKDWHLITGWQAAGIPVGTVIRAVRDIFAKRKARGAAGKISSLAYCALAIEELWAFERRGLAGGGTGRPGGTEIDAPGEVLAIREALAARALSPPEQVEAGKFALALEKAVARLDAVPSGAGIDALEEELASIEEALLRSLRKSLTGSAPEELASRVEALLAGTDDLAPSARDRLRRALARRELRAMLDLPALSVLGG
jgi:hypothetical protein